MPPRSIWTGAITFGLVTIPVKVYTAVGREGDERLDLHLLHAKDGTRVRYERTCEKGHRDIDWQEVVKGYEHGKGKWVEITSEELEALELESLRTIEVSSFVPYDQIDPVYFDKSYYLVPEEAAIKAYRLMAGALGDENVVGVGKVAMREREHLCVLRAADDLILLETMHWPEEVREAGFEQLRKKVQPQASERRMARQLIQQLSDDFDPGRFHDEYHAALKKLIERKAAGKEIAVPQPSEEPRPVADLMEALKASVEAVKGGRKPSRGRARPAPAGAAADGQDLRSLGKSQLEERARDIGVKGRSKMDRAHLLQAIRRAS